MFVHLREGITFDPYNLYFMNSFIEETDSVFLYVFKNEGP